MEYAADDINIGYMSILLMINNEKTLVDKLDNIKEIYPQYEAAYFGTHKGGVKFSCVLKGTPTVVEITMNVNGNFSIHTLTNRGSTTFHDEDRLLQDALDRTTYRKIAKRMHYRENFGNDLSGD